VFISAKLDREKIFASDLESGEERKWLGACISPDPESNGELPLTAYTREHASEAGAHLVLSGACLPSLNLKDVTFNNKLEPDFTSFKLT
jgi:hypothetical protein